MKRKLPTGLCVLIALALVAFGLFYGTFAGFQQERAKVEELLANGLQTVLDYRGADGMNLCVVARRHLGKNDPDVLTLEAAAHTLQSSEASLQEKSAVALEAAVETLSRRLRESASFQASERDGRYLEMILADLNSLSAATAVTAYNRAAANFNTQLSAPLTGSLARWMGIQECPLFEQGVQP